MRATPKDERSWKMCCTVASSSTEERVRYLQVFLGGKKKPRMSRESKKSGFVSFMATQEREKQRESREKKERRKKRSLFSPVSFLSSSPLALPAVRLKEVNTVSGTDLALLRRNDFGTSGQNSLSLQQHLRGHKKHLTHSMR